MREGTLDSITLENFRSYREQKFDLDPGINIFIGSSESGKTTAALRSIKWIDRNRPTGKAVVSYWNRDKNKNPVSDTSVKLMFNDGNVITRTRGKDFNGYNVNGIVLEAVGMDVPSDVESALNFGEVNFHHQYDQPFLLSSSAADIARFFNKTIGLDDIDRILGEVETKRQRLNKELSKIEEEIFGIGVAVKALEWVDEAVILIDSVDSLSGVIEQSEGEMSALSQLMNDDAVLLASIGGIERLLVCEPFLEAIAALDISMREHDLMVALIDEIKKTNIVLDGCKKMLGIEMLVAEAVRYREEADIAVGERTKLSPLVDRFEVELSNIQSQNSLLEVLIKKLPLPCPVCKGTGYMSKEGV
jgi:exonuclease SbcC